MGLLGDSSSDKELNAARKRLETFAQYHTAVNKKMKDEFLKNLNLMNDGSTKSSKAITGEIEKKFERLRTEMGKPLRSSEDIRKITENLKALESAFPEQFRASKYFEEMEIEVFGGQSKFGQKFLANQARQQRAVERSLKSAGVDDAKLRKSMAKEAMQTGTAAEVIGIEENLRIVAAAEGDGADKSERGVKIASARIRKAKQLAGKHQSMDLKKQAYDDLLIQEEAHSGASKLLAGRHSWIGAAARMIDPLQNLRQAEEDEAAGLGEMGAGQVIASLGIEKLSGMFNKLMPAIGLVGGIGRIFSAMVDSTGRAMNIGGRQLQAYGMSGTTAFGNTAAAAVIGGFEVQGALGDMMTEAALAGVDIQEVLKPAQGATISIGHASRASADEFTLSFAKIAASAATVGMEVPAALNASVAAQRAFGLSSKQTEGVFAGIRKAIRLTGMSYEELAVGIGDVTALGKSWGDQSDIYEQMAKVVAGADLSSTSRKQLMTESIMGFIKQPIAQQVGWTMASMPQGRRDTDAAMHSIIAAGKGGKLAKFGQDRLQGILKNNNAMTGLDVNSKFNERLKTGMLIQQMTGGGQTLVDAIVKDPKFAKDMVFGTGNREEVDKRMRDIREADDPTLAGVRIMGLQQDAVTKLAGIVDQIFQLLANSVWLKAANTFDLDSPSGQAHSKAKGMIQGLMNGIAGL